MKTPADPNHPSLKPLLVRRYLEAVDALCRRYPAQEPNRAGYTAWAASARVGVATRRIRTKGGFTDIAAGTPVLFTPHHDSDMPDTVSVWAPREDGGETRTIVSSRSVRTR